MQSRLHVVRSHAWTDSGRLLNKNVMSCEIGGDFTIKPQVVATEEAFLAYDVNLDLHGIELSQTLPCEI